MCTSLISLMKFQNQGVYIMDHIRVALGNQIKQKREKKKLTLKQVAERSHISEQKIAALESGQGDFPIGYLFTLASILKFKPQSLLAQCERERRQRMKGIINLLLTCPDETLVKIEEYIRKLAAKQ